MPIEQALLETLSRLPPQKQQEVLDFAVFLRSRAEATPTPRRSLEGLWADLEVRLTEQDILEARQEMWGRFPRDLSR